MFIFILFEVAEWKFLLVYAESVKLWSAVFVIVFWSKGLFLLVLCVTHNMQLHNFCAPYKWVFVLKLQVKSFDKTVTLLRREMVV